MKVGVKTLLALMLSGLIAGIPSASMADGIPSPPSRLSIGETITTPPPPTPVGNEGLLSGMTPGNYKLSSGWMLVRATDFEGTKPAGETWALWDASIKTDRWHSGSKSLGGTYAADQADVAWRLSGSTVGEYKEIYLSFYEYIESQALFNDEFFMVRFAVQDPFQEVILDWMWTSKFNDPSSGLWVVPQGTYTKRYNFGSHTVPKGAWVQWEIHFRPNTRTGGVVNLDGFFRLYKDGVLFRSVENVNLNGTRSMNSSQVDVGGTYTKLTWMTDNPTCSVPSGCSSGPGIGTDYCTSKLGRNSFSAPKCAPVDPPLAPFKRYFDDIIVMKK